ncbi:MAG: SGNH/GDSL hydrolase family protein [Treponema sp.]|nr:SGNH/GDSL hydrolase family protein [Treponema sp.]
MKEYKLNQIKDKKIIGRNIASAGQSEKEMAIFWGGSGIELCIKASEVWAKFSANYQTSEPWLAVFVNGAQISRFMITKGPAQWYCLARNLNPQKENTISILKDTQPMSGEALHSLFLEEIGLDDQGIFCPLKKKALSIEFIGDSITSGEGLAGGPEEWEWITQWFRASDSYAVKTAQALNADFSVLSQCGWGIAWGWDGDRRNALPPHYDNVCSVMWGEYQEKLGIKEKYDFKGGSDYVVINLGTNDNGAFDQPAWKDENGKEYPLHKDKNGLALEEDGNIVKAAVKDFLKNIRLHNPKAKIIWTWGMIKLKAIPPYIAKGLEEYKNESGDKAVYSLEFDAMEDVEKLPEDKGSRGHPGPLTHYLASKKLTAFIKSLM